MKEKNLELERLVFFSDAVVAIAITLLALDLKIEPADEHHLRFSDIGKSWEKFFAFFLSFYIIAIFWRVHHQFFFYIKEISGRLLVYNLAWLLFIVLLPFTTSMISKYTNNTPAMFLYSCNVLCIVIFQNNIWDYVSEKPGFLKEKASKEVVYDYRITCNLSMINAVVAVIVSLFSPIAAVIILISRFFLFKIARKIFKYKPAKEQA